MQGELNDLMSDEEDEPPPQQPPPRQTPPQQQQQQQQQQQPKKSSHPSPNKPNRCKNKPSKKCRRSVQGGTKTDGNLDKRFTFGTNFGLGAFLKVCVMM